MALRAVTEHPKFSHLKALLRAPKGAALGWLEIIWHFCAKNAPQGNIGRFSDAEIESWCEWDGEPGALIAALVASRWLDLSEKHRILVHDWPDHADNSTKTWMRRRNVDILEFYSNMSQTGLKQVGDQLEQTPRARMPVPVPVPVPAKGALTLGRGKTARVRAKIPPELDSPEFCAAWAKRMASVGRRIPSVARQSQLDEAAGWGLGRALAAVRHSMAYVALIEPIRNGKASHLRPEERPAPPKAKRELRACAECGHQETGDDRDAKTDDANPVEFEAKPYANETPNAEAEKRLAGKIICWNCQSKLFPPKADAHV